MPEPTPAPGEPQKDKTPPVAAQPGMPVPEPPEVEPAEPPKKDPLKAQEEIIPESKRFKEVYGNMKGFERKVGEQQEVITGIQEHNKKLQVSLDEINDRYSDTSRPDPTEDPEGYGKWVNAQIDKGIERGLRDKTPAPNPAMPSNAPPADTNLAIQIGVQEGLHDNYNEIIGEVQGDIDNDDVLRNKIASSGNPPKAAYQYGLEKRELAKKDRDNLLNRNYVEPGGGAPPPPPADGQPTDGQKQMAANLGVSVDKYMEQVKQINAGKRRA